MPPLPSLSTGIDPGGDAVDPKDFMKEEWRPVMMLLARGAKTPLKTCWSCRKEVVAIDAASRVGGERRETPTGRCFDVLAPQRPELSTKNTNALLTYANDSDYFSADDCRRTGSGATFWMVALDGEFNSLSDELSAEFVRRSVRELEVREASSDPLKNRGLASGDSRHTEGWP